MHQDFVMIRLLKLSPKLLLFFAVTAVFSFWYYGVVSPLYCRCFWCNSLEIILQNSLTILVSLARNLLPCLLLLQSFILHWYQWISLCENECLYSDGEDGDGSYLSLFMPQQKGEQFVSWWERFLPWAYCAFLFITVNAINVVPLQEHQSAESFPGDVLLAIPYSV